MKYWIDGKLVSEKSVQVPFLTHSLHYGSGIFEGIRFYKTENGPAIFRLKDHVKRFFYSAGVLGMEMPYSQKELIHATVDVVAVNGFPEGYIRPFAYFGNNMGLDPKGVDTHIGIAAWPYEKYLTGYVRVTTSSFMRIHPSSIDVEAKISGHYVNSILATQEARKQGFDEALLLDVNGNIAEGPAENIFFVTSKNVVTPKRGTILPGITRDSVMTILSDLGYSINEKDIKPAEITKYEEAFFTGTATKVTPIKSIDDKVFARNDVSEQTKDAYQAVVTGKNKKYEKWLTRIT